MGSTTSTNTYQQPAKKYTDADIRKNIDELFNNARTNNFSEVSYSINDLDNIIITDVPQNGGIKFNSSQKRYLRHKIDENNLQTGGNDNMEEISDMSEFQRIKEYLINDMKNNQSGGDFDVDDMVSSATVAQNSNSNPNLIKFLSALKGGNDDDLDDDEDEAALEDDDEDDEGLEEDEDDDEEGLDEDDDDDKSSEKKSKKTKKERKEEDFDEDKKSTEVEISETSEDGIIRNPEEYSATSFIEKSSELNILPFYSSDSNINKHPYIKNRIH